MRLKPATLAVVGGGDCYARHRVRACTQNSTKHSVLMTLCLPPHKWATDNAAMIAMATWDYIDCRGIEADLEPQPNLKLGRVT